MGHGGPATFDLTLVPPLPRAITRLEAAMLGAARGSTASCCSAICGGPRFRAA
jgi:hypothetical protein